MSTATILWSIPIGLVVGTLLTMVIDCVPDDLTLLGRPRLPHCEVSLGARELVPVV